MAKKSISTLFVDLQASTQKLEKDLSKVGDKIGPKLKMIGKKAGLALAAGISAGLAGATVLTKKGLESIDALNKQAESLGMTTAQLQAFQFQAGLAGIKAEAFDKSIVKMISNVDDAANGIGTAKDALEELGLRGEDLQKLSSSEQFAIIADKIKGLEDQTKRTALAYDIFGRSGADVVRMLSQGSQGIEDARSQLKEMGVALNSVDTAKVEMANDAMLRLGQFSKFVSQQLAINLAPIIKGVADSLSEWATQNNGIKESVQKLVSFIASGIGMVLDVVHQLKRAFKGIEAIVLGFASVVSMTFQGLEVGLRTAVSGWIKMINLLIQAWNKIPFSAKIKELDDSIAESSFFGTATEGLTARIAEVNGELVDLANQPLPTQTIKEWVKNLEEAATKASTEIAKTRASAIQGVQDIEIGTEQPKSKLEELGDKTKEFGDRMGVAVANSITDLNSLGDVVKNIGNIIKQELINQLILAPIRSFIGSAVGGFFGALGSSFGGGKATGGTVGGGKTYLVGERGPELFSPSGNGHIHPAGTFGGGGGSTIVLDMKGSMVSVDAFQQIQALVNQINGSVEPRAIAAVQNARQRSGGFLTR